MDHAKNYIKLKEGLSCSKLILGSMMLSEEQIDQSLELMDAYVAAGGNTIDTAHIYGASSSRAVGIWMQQRNNRSSVVIIGKGAHPDHNGPRVTLEAIEQDLEETFERMQTDYVDIMMLHRDDLNAHKLEGFTCNSPNLSLAKPNEPRWTGCISIYADDAAWHEKTQLPLLSWSSQAGGFFTGRYTPDHGDAEMIRVYYSEENWERYRRAGVLAMQKGVSTNDVALAFVLNQSFPTCALVGPNDVSELRSSTKALDVTLTVDECRWLDLRADTHG